MNEIENEFLVVKTKNIGAEVCSIFNKKTQLEYVWQAGPEWPKHAPVLFPFVGQLKNNVYHYLNQSFQSDRHGFARAKLFNVEFHNPTKIIFALTDDDKTFQIYPFHFKLSIQYELNDNKLNTTYFVQNTDSKDMYFSIGAHPAFKVPLHTSETYSDYYLHFDQNEDAPAYSLNHGLLNGQTKPVFTNENKLMLYKELFYHDALVFKHLKSERISIRSKTSDNGLNFIFKNFPFFGIWAAKDADFICLEPWHGVTDSVNHNQDLVEKEGIILLPAKDSFSCNFTIDTY